MSLTSDLPNLKAQGLTLDLSPERFGFMRDSSDIVNDADALRRRIAEDGYLLMRGLLDREEVIAARRTVADRLASDGLLDRSAPLFDCIAKPGAMVTFKPDVALDNPALMKVLYDGPMIGFFQTLLGEPVRHYDFTWFRAVSPGLGTPAHCDVVYMGRGETQQLYTAWTPIGDVPLDVGGLMILESSNNIQRLRETYGATDVDSYCENRPDKKEGGSRFHGALSKNAVQIQRSLGGRWLTCPDYRMGDVVIFSVYTVHAGLDNLSNQIRLSSDTRYQPASAAADERWVGVNPIGHSLAGKRGRTC